MPTSTAPRTAAIDTSTMHVEHVRLPALGWDIAADLYFPDGFDTTKQHPVIISAHPVGSCKEQTSGNVYGAALAKAGFLVIAFDASFQGDSGGQPRFIEDPTFRVQDFSYVVDYLVTLPYVDADRIGLLGICGGGGYSIAATMTERRIKALGTVVAANYGRMMNETAMDWDPIEALEKIADQRTEEARGADRDVIDDLPASPEAARENGMTERDVYEATEYYRTDRGAAPHGANRWLYSRQSTAIGWDAFERLEVLLTQPLCIVVGDKPGSFGSYRDGLEVKRRAASTDKELVIVEGASHYDLYDQPEPVKIALEHLVPFFQSKL